jgi:leucyl/phenylalanyl-tRNA--protein transferase
MVEKCRELGYEIFDAQVMNPHLASLGAYPMPHEDYMRLLQPSLATNIVWPRDP